MKALVIGAAGTIGQACVERLARDGYDVIAADLTAPSAAGAAGIGLDVTDPDAVKAAIDHIESSGPIQALVYAAGLNTTGPLDQTDWSDYERVMAVNLRGAFHVGWAIQPHLRTARREFGAAFISSTAGLAGEAGGSIYCASKFGLIGFVQSFASEIGPLRARANAVCPGNVDSPMLSVLADKIGTREGRSGESVMAELVASNAFHRLIDPAEVADTCAWLVSPQSGAISGQTIVVDGARP